MFNMGNMQNMMKQAQKIQERINQAQEDVAKLEVVGESGAGLVKVTMTGKHEVRRVEIDPTLFSDDKEMCEDLIAAAFNDAVRRVEEQSRALMEKATAGIPLPPGMKFPF